MSRKIIHVDMDAFFAAVEQRDYPELKGQPVVVGGNPNSRGVVATCSYEARKYGIHSAMPSSRAYQLCPHAVFVKPRFSAYKEASIAIHHVFNQYTDIIEPLSLDEAFMDVSECEILEGSATLIAKNIRENIYKEIELTASAGISYNKFLAKLASDQKKPNGQYVIKPGEAEKFLLKLPIGRFYGVGKVTERKMIDAGIETGGDLKNKTIVQLQKLFGNSAKYYFNISRGVDERPVSNSRVRKSLGSETTFQHDLSDKNIIIKELEVLLDDVLLSLKQKELVAYTITIKVKYTNFKQVTRSYSGESALSLSDSIKELIPILLDKTDINKEKVRLLGVMFSNLVHSENYKGSSQLTLF